MPIGGTVKLTGESEYKKALRDITQQLKEVSSESKAVSSQYDKTDKSEKALTDQSKALNKQLETQKDRIELMKKRYDELSHSEGVSEEELSKLRTQINNATADMNKTERQIKSLGSETETTGKRFDGLGETLGKIGKAAGVALAAIGTAAVGAGKKLYDMAKQTAEAGDEIDKNSQKVGLSAESYQKWDYAMQVAGTEMSSCTTGLKTLTNTFDDANNGSKSAAEKFERLGLSMENIKDLSREDLFGAVVKSLQNVTDETEKAAIANDLFGKSGQDLIPLFNMTNDELEGLMQQAEDYGMIMSNEAVAASADFKDSLTKLSGTMDGLRNQMISDLLPGLTDIANGFAGLLAGVEGAEQDIQNGVQALAESISKVLPQLVSMISSVLQAILKEAPEIFKSLAQSLLDTLPEILPKVGEAIGQIGAAIIKMVPEILKALPEILKGITQGLIDATGEILAAIGEVLFGIETNYTNLTEKINKQNDTIRENRKALEELNPQLAEYDRLLSSSGNTLSDLDEIIKTNEDAITEVLRTALEEQRGLREEDIQSLLEYNQNILDAEAEKMEIYRGQQVAALRKLQLESGTITRETAAQHLADTKAALDQANNATEEAYTARISTIEQKYAAINQVGSKAYQVELEAAKRTHDAQIRENQSYYNEAVQIVQNYSKQWVQLDSDKWHVLSQEMRQYSINTGDEVKNQKNAWSDWIGASRIYSAKMIEAISSMDRESANAFLNMAAQVKSTGGDIDSETQQIATDILGAFDDLPEYMDEAGKDSLLGLIGGLEDEIPKLKDASEMTSNEIVDTIKEYLGIHSPSTVLAEVGVNAMKGLEQGVQQESVNAAGAAQTAVVAFVSPFRNAYSDFYSVGANMGSGLKQGFLAQEYSISIEIKYMMRRLVTAAKREMQISSPSKVWAQIGDYMAQGLDEGFVEEMKYVTQDITNAIPSSVDISAPSYNAQAAASDNMVEAFKKALSEMKVELDSESVGEFVDKTVTTLVYS